MEFALKNGDYRPDGLGSFETVTGPEALLQRALLRLAARRGCLPWLPELGSRLHTLSAVRPAEREGAALAYAAEALAPEPEVRVDGVSLSQPEEGRLRVTVTLRAGTRQAVVEVSP
ncbi:MAG: hypothetical protein LBT60_07740 [Oscillospiraceae bacterium]|jgi:phage gp46-like protein|nr:hypothetical protein [Oscillospiraceae bacterium]